MTYRFEYRRYDLPLRVAVRTAHGIWTTRGGVMVRIENDQRIAGFGEAAPISWFGTETVDEIEDACRELGPMVDRERLLAVPERLGCLRNAIHAALNEIDGRAPASALTTSGEPEAGADSRRDHVPADPDFRSIAALLPAGSAAIPEIALKAEAGFRIFKWKVGIADLADELALLDDLCAALPSGAKLRLDANGAWDRRRAARCLARCAERPVEFLEQPIARDARGADDLLLGLAGDFPTPLALDESLVGMADIERWLGAGWPGVYVVKLSLLGDVERVMGRLAKANSHVVFSSALETAVGARAALRHAFAWRGERRALGFGVWPLFADARFNGPTAVPFLRREDVERIDPEAVWNALG